MRGRAVRAGVVPLILLAGLVLVSATQPPGAPTAVHSPQHAAARTTAPGTPAAARIPRRSARATGAPNRGRTAREYQRRSHAHAARRCALGTARSASRTVAYGRRHVRLV